MAKTWLYEGEQLTAMDIAKRVPYSEKWTRKALAAGATTYLEMMQFAHAQENVSREAGLRGSKRAGLRAYSY